MIKTINTHTGKIFVDAGRRLEFLMVGDYGKENNIKADFLGLNKEIYGVTHKEVDLSEKLVLTLSTQKGCPMNCQFCDCPKYGFYGNASFQDLCFELTHILIVENENVPYTKRLNVHFARMGEPTFNPNVLTFTQNALRSLTRDIMKADVIHPVVSTMLPKDNPDLLDFLYDWCNIKNNEYHGEAGLQFSINSTDDAQREQQFSGKSHSLDKIATIARILPKPKGRKYTLNFAVTKDTILDADVLSNYFDKDNFIVKLTPIHRTKAAIQNNFDVTTEYSDFNVYRTFEQPLLERGWDVITFVPSEEEDSDRITCGNALIAYENNE